MEQESYKLETALRTKAEAELARVGLSSRPSEGMLSCDLLYMVKRSLSEVDSRTRDALSNAAEALHYARNRCALLSFDDIAAESGEDSGKQLAALHSYIEVLDPYALIVLEAAELPTIDSSRIDLPTALILDFIGTLDDPAAQKKSWQLMKKAGYIPH